MSVAPMNRCSYVVHDSSGGDLRCVRLSCHTGPCDYEEKPEPYVGDMSIPNKVLAHVTRVEFGEVCAKMMIGGAWAIFDARGYRQGAHMVDEGLSFQDAVTGAYRVSCSTPGTKHPADPEAQVTPRQEAAFTLYRLALERLLAVKAVRVTTAADSKARWERICDARERYGEAHDELDASIADELDDGARLVFEVSGREKV